MRILVTSAVSLNFFTAVLFCSSLCAAVYEVHPGVFSSYEYTDNYFGTVHDKHNESIYLIGPSIGLSVSTPSLSWENSGRITRSYHRKYDEEESLNALFDSHAAASWTHHSLDLAYTYSLTSRRESLDDPLGKIRIQTGSLGYGYELTPETLLSLGYRTAYENNPYPEENLTTQGPSVGLTHQLTQRQRLSLTYDYLYHRYELSDNTWVSTSNAHWGYMLTSRLEIGTGFMYMHEDRGRLSSENIYNASVTAGYVLTRNTDIDVSGGYSWLNMEEQDRQGSYTLDVEMTTETRYDVFLLSASRGYTAEFTTDRYGTYITKSASISWDRTLMRTLSASVTGTYESREPTADTEAEKERDLIGRVSLIWEPVEYLSATTSFEHLQEGYEISDTVRENRYRITIEGRY
ncbi:MAG: hypothetical protein JXM72_08905 [Deltaproteobacteria bacterium]|nr:hypothetical protein [Deltaproteobacteria bacterium]